MNNHKMVYIGVIGEGECSPQTADFAFRAGGAIASAGAVLVCGGLGGVMLEACRGAREAGGITLGILPGFNRHDANPFVDYAIPTGMGEARNVIVVRASDALLAVGGSYGTLSEMAFALRFGKPLAGIGTWKLTHGRGEAVPVEYFDDPARAVESLVSRVAAQRSAKT